ncbi:MAG: hypothetical protein ACUVX8_11015 [Candidatus Zipacnadales bacterium]
MLEHGAEGFTKSGCPLATAYMGSTLFQLQLTGQLPPGSRGCFAPDYLVVRPIGKPTATDPTPTASAGLFDVTAGIWTEELLTALGLSLEAFPEIAPFLHYCWTNPVRHFCRYALWRQSGKFRWQCGRLPRQRTREHRHGRAGLRVH